ncbi:Beta-amyrin 28-oxidase [Vitis vinifera]|uniref:Beta-amyrin 28-monooxygenase n=1 Tax=Vitis vinifera TaxID=29760 RepID=A0A438DPT9_VITVI|nr:Beta-amyrin 28-oxidase [Vitis vinifera]
MDLFSYLLHLIVLFVSLCIIFLVSRRKSACSKLPPGKLGWPIIGETLEFALGGKNSNPARFINDRMKKYSPIVFRTSLLGEKVAVFCGPAGNKFLFSNHNKLITTWKPPSMEKALLFQSSPPKAEPRGMRSFVLEFLRPDALQRNIHIMDSMARQNINMDWAPHKEVNVYPLSKKYTFTLACHLFISIKDPEHIARIARPFHQMLSGLVSLPIDFPGTAFNSAKKGGKILRHELVAIIKQRRKELSEKEESVARDLLSSLLLATDENGAVLNDMEISDKIVGIFLASFDSTSTTLTFIFNYLAEFPHAYDKVLKEQMEIAMSKDPEEFLKWNDIQKMKYTWCVVKETMRLAPPAQGTFREAITDFTFEGFTIPKGWKTYWSVHSTNKNPKYFPDPEKFDPSRFEGKGPAPYTFVPFGGGPRLCPGKEYVRLVILVFIHNMVTRFKWEKVVPNEKIIYNPSPFPVNGLPIRLQPHEK